MKPDQAKKSLAVIMPLMFAIACGGGSPTSTPDVSTPDIGEAISDSQTVTGRVADGYLQGAIVCVDINENGQCDPGEPQVESGEGGSYALDIQSSNVGKPILAEVPATAIDEDTGLPFGKELVLSTPGDKPEFVSPITTLVHQELKNNPNLNTDDAAAAVLETLGLPDEEDSSLFTDYVAKSDDDDEQQREKFKFLHQTARVVASMLDEIHTSVESAASEQGIDVDSQETAAAIRQLVREEVRNQLPDISAAVAERIREIEELAASGGAQEIRLTDEFNPDSISESLGKTSLTKDIAEKIDAAKHEAPAEIARMDEVLASGIYIIDVDCERNDEYESEDGLVEPAVDQHAVILNDEGVPEIIEMPEYCSAGYTHVITEAIDDTAVDGSLNDDAAVEGAVPAAANLVVTHYHYGFDDTTGSKGWIMEEQEHEDTPHLLTLVNGDWLPVQHDGPYGVVEFTADGAAVMNTDEGKLLVYASSRDLSGKSVLHHVLNRGDDKKLAGLVDESQTFPTGSSAHKLHIKRNASLIVMFNWYPEEQDYNAVDYCAQYGGNCNVVYVKDDAAYGSLPLASLTEFSDGTVIDSLAHDRHENLPIDVALNVHTLDATTTLTGKIAGDTSTADAKSGGIATWTISPRHYGIEAGPGVEPYPIDKPAPIENQECIKEISSNENGIDIQLSDEPAAAVPYCPQPVDHVSMVCKDANQDIVTIMVPSDHPAYSSEDQKAIQENQGLLANGEQVSTPNCPLPPTGSEAGVALNDLAPDGTVVERSDALVIGESRWHTVTIQGVDMVAIEVPVSVRHRMDEDEVAEMLLIQDGEFVRRGARIAEHAVDDETAYNAEAFDTLLPVVEDYVDVDLEQPLF